SSISFHSQKSAGFTPISKELIHISSLIETKANDLFQIMFKSLRTITESQKIARNQSLQKKFFQDYNKRSDRNYDLTHLENKILSDYNNKRDKLKEDFQIQFQSFQKIIRETIKLCKNTRPIVFSVKIESVYIEGNEGAFDELSKELSDFISKIEDLLKRIENLNQRLLEGN
ncbi:MAG TPA: hypothetical protein PKL30_20430, partial [Leptospiraceae bacterium]|nr:hypothetical protein [Leptospiraceae bacterium]